MVRTIVAVRNVEKRKQGRIVGELRERSKLQEGFLPSLFPVIEQGWRGGPCTVLFSLSLLSSFLVRLCWYFSDLQSSFTLLQSRVCLQLWGRVGWRGEACAVLALQLLQLWAPIHSQAASRLQPPAPVTTRASTLPQNFMFSAAGFGWALPEAIEGDSSWFWAEFWWLNMRVPCGVGQSDSR